MKKFTVKDFIAYNNPCFSCGNQINFNIGVIFNTLEEAKVNLGGLRPVVSPDRTEIDLSIKYSNAVKLYIDHKTNKISTNDRVGLAKYLEGHSLFLKTGCDQCHTM